MLYDTVDLKMGRHKPLKAESFLQLVTEEVEGRRGVKKTGHNHCFEDGGATLRRDVGAFELLRVIPPPLLTPARI